MSFETRLSKLEAAVSPVVVLSPEELARRTRWLLTYSGDNPDTLRRKSLLLELGKRVYMRGGLLRRRAERLGRPVEPDDPEHERILRLPPGELREAYRREVGPFPWVDEA